MSTIKTCFPLQIQKITTTNNKIGPRRPRQLRELELPQQFPFHCRRTSAALTLSSPSSHSGVLLLALDLASFWSSGGFVWTVRSLKDLRSILPQRVSGAVTEGRRGQAWSWSGIRLSRYLQHTHN
jgi:hypothetical protein